MGKDDIAVFNKVYDDMLDILPILPGKLFLTMEKEGPRFLHRLEALLPEHQASEEGA